MCLNWKTTVLPRTVQSFKTFENYNSFYNVAIILLLLLTILIDKITIFLTHNSQAPNSTSQKAIDEKKRIGVFLVEFELSEKSTFWVC